MGEGGRLSQRSPKKRVSFIRSERSKPDKQIKQRDVAMSTMDFAKAFVSAGRFLLLERLGIL
jgi:hypothetical protein